MSYRMITLPSDEPVQFVGVYVLKWKDVIDGGVTEPTVGFVEEDEEEYDEEYAPGLPEPED